MTHTEIAYTERAHADIRTHTLHIYTYIRHTKIACKREHINTYTWHTHSKHRDRAHTKTHTYGTHTEHTSGNAQTHTDSKQSYTQRAHENIDLCPF